MANKKIFKIIKKVVDIHQKVCYDVFRKEVNEWSISIS